MRIKKITIVMVSREEVKEEEQEMLNIYIESNGLEQVKNFQYLKINIERNGK